MIKKEHGLLRSPWHPVDGTVNGEHVKVAQYVLKTLEAEGITHIFMVPGGLIDPFLPALAAEENTIVPIIAAQEGGAAYMADGYARASGKFGACLCIGGPGITNTVTPLAAAYTDEFPVFLISGEVPTCWEGKGAFQDSSPGSDIDDIVTLRAVTAHELIVENIKSVAFDMRKLLIEMLSPPRRPVHLALPKNIQHSDLEQPPEKLPESLYHPRQLDSDQAGKFWDVIGDSSNIVILAGAGVEKSDATQELIQFAETYSIPVATTLRGKGVFPEDHELSLGIFGYSGTRHAIQAVMSEEAQVLMILGSGLNQRDTLFWSRKFHASKKLIQVDNDLSVMGSTFQIDLPVAGDCRTFLEELNAASAEKTQTLLQAKSKREEWIASIRAAGSRLYDEENCASDAVPIHPARVVRDLRNVMPRDTVLLVDSGAHRAFCGHYWESYAPREYISATNLGPMGWAIPAAVGVKMACPAKPCVVVTGDGCMLMHGMEIQTAARYGADILYVVINNSALGNVYLRAKQHGPKAAAYTELPTHHWAAFAESLGVKGIRITEPDNLTAAFEEARATPGPVLVEVMCGKDYPTPVTPYSESQKEWFNNA